MSENINCNIKLYFFVKWCYLLTYFFDLKFIPSYIGDANEFKLSIIVHKAHALDK